MDQPTKRLNVRLFVWLAGAAIAAVVAVFVVHKIQVARNAGGLASLARAKLAEGKAAEALALFSRYIAYRPNDAVAQAEFARLLVERAEDSQATAGDRRFAYGALETAVRKNPRDLPLRRKLADWMLRYGRFADAAGEIAVIRDHMAADPKLADVIDLDELALLDVRACNGQGKYREAAEAAAEVLGFDLVSKTFDDSRVVGRSAFEASLLLSSLLSDRLYDRPSAATILAHLTATHGDDHRSWLALANWQRSQGDLEQAAAAAAKATTLAPDDADVLFTSLEIAVGRGQTDVGARLAARASELFPEDERSFRGMAAVAAQRGDVDGAIEILREGLKQQPGRTPLLVMLATMLLQADRVTEAEEMVREVVERSGEQNPLLGLLQARIMIAQQQWLKAKQKLDAIRPLVAASDQLTRQIDLFLGQCHEQLGEFDQQLAVNRRVLSDDTDSLAARVGVATALVSAGQPEQALAEFESITASLPAERLPAVPQVWTPLLQLRIGEQMKRPAEDRDWTRVDQLVERLETSPQIDDAQVAVLRSDVLVRRGDPAAAEAVLQKALAANPASPQLRSASILLALREHGTQTAIGLLEQVPPALFDDPLLLLVRAQVAARMPAAEAAALFAAIEARIQDLPAAASVRLLSTLGTLRRGAGDRDEAERLWEAALAKSPDNLPVLAALFESACEAGDVARAGTFSREIGRVTGSTSPSGRVAAAAHLVLGVRVRVRDAQAGGDRQKLPATPHLSAADLEQLTAAKNLLVEAENERPGWSQIQQLFAEVAILQGEVPTAIDRLRKAARLGRASPLIVRQLVALLYRANRLDEAEQALALVGPDGPEDIARLSAEFEMRSGQFEAAVASAEKTLAGKESPSAEELLWFGQLLNRAGKQQRAVEILQRATEADPGQPAAWTALVACQVASGQGRAAEKSMAESGKHLEPPARQLVAAQGYELLKRPDDAERAFRDAVAAAPQDASAVRSLASFLIRRGRLPAAREVLEQMIASMDDGAGSSNAKLWARRTLAELTAQGGSYRDVERAIAMLEENAAGGASLPEDLQLELAILSSRPEPRNWRRAIAIYERLARLQPLSAADRLQRAELHERLGDWRNCRDELEQLASDADATTSSLGTLIQKLVEHGELDSADAWLKNLSARAPDALLTLALRTRLALARNDRSAALAAARRLLPNAAGTPSANAPPGPLAALLEDLGFDQAADRLLADHASSSADGVVARAAFLGRQKRLEEGLDLLESSWERLPLERLLQAALSVLRLNGGATGEQVVRVERWFARAGREDPDSATLPLLHAEFISMSAPEEDAVKLYRDILAAGKLPPVPAAVAANNLAFLLAGPANNAEAERFVEQALAELGPHPDVLDTRGVILLESGRGREAVNELREAVLSPSATKYLHLACALADQNLIDEARQATLKARQLGLDQAVLNAADRGRLERLQATIGM